MLYFKNNVAPIEGWLTKSEAEFLYKEASRLSNGSVIVEIGSWKGRSTICLGLGVRNCKGTKIYAIDPHTGASEQKRRLGKVDTYKEFISNTKKTGVSKFIIPVRTTSEEAAKKLKGEVDFVFVDGAHEYAFVKKDWELWFPRLKTGKLIAFHDCWHMPGVHLQTAKILLVSNKIKNPKLIDTITAFEKVDKNTLLDRVNNIFFIIYRLLFGWIGTIKIDQTCSKQGRVRKE